MAEAVKELTLAGNLKKSSYETVANWVRDSWNAVDVDLIRKSFKYCGISNKHNGTEDDWIFNYDRLGQGNQLGDEVEIPSDNERGNEEDKEGETDNEYVGEEGEMDEETDEEYVDEEEETDEEYVDERGEEDEEREYEGEEDGYDNEYYGHYDQGTNYINVWND
ncbi:oocyte zinc finger protein XlCOF7.1-like isoform X2 [Rhizophagus clarus]|uniref:Oocyte zinc finger protein XlCOF7.1-like isoform X2 n=1 Tax=Rhizophagus clarus TaxID=94130 RepID=A0A8H3L446_9GLOM|nr:oocyte zinc finger protein XlCOF7.1-like isoform X2 [Rhizophagus clarus]